MGLSMVGKKMDEENTKTVQKLQTVTMMKAKGRENLSIFTG